MTAQKRSLKIGDVVRLKSGGPWMTVTGEPTSDDVLSADEVGTADCSWFEEFPESAEQRWVLQMLTIETEALELKDAL